MKKQKHKTIKLGYFPIWLEVFVGGTLQEVPAKVKKLKIDIPGGLEEWANETSCCRGRTFMHYDTRTAIMWLYKKDVPVIAHEAVHIAFFVNEKLGGIFNPESQESCCYLVEHIVREIMEMK